MKRTTNGTRGNEGNPLPNNNEVLIDQIKMTIISDYYPNLLSKKREGLLEFFVRDGEVNKNCHIKALKFGAKFSDDAGQGMSRKSLANFLAVIEETLRDWEEVIAYGDVFISFKVDEDGNLFDGEIRVKTYNHHVRKA